MASDWLKLHRCILDSEIFNDDWLTRLWVWCLCKSNFRESSFRGQVVHRGQFVTGRVAAADELRVSPSKWYRGMQRLTELGNITTESNSNWTTVTICKFDDYQDCTTEKDRSVNSQRTADDTTTGQPVTQPADTIEEDQEFKNEYKETPSPQENSDFESQSLTMLNGPSEAFREFMAVYPLPAYPNLAWKAWQSEVAEMTMQGMTDAQAESTLIDAAKAYAESPAGRPPADPGNDFRPSPAKFISGGKYLEPPSLWQSPNARSQARGRGGGRSKPSDARMRELDDYLNTEGPK